MKTKTVIAAHLQKGQRVKIDWRDGFYLIQKVTKRGSYIDLELQGVLFPVCLWASDSMRVKV